MGRLATSGTRLEREVAVAEEQSAALPTEAANHDHGSSPLKTNVG
jgi:hypothetical protein